MSSTEQSARQSVDILQQFIIKAQNDRTLKQQEVQLWQDKYVAACDDNKRLSLQLTRLKEENQQLKSMVGKSSSTSEDTRGRGVSL